MSLGISCSHDLQVLINWTINMGFISRAVIVFVALTELSAMIAKWIYTNEHCIGWAPPCFVQETRQG